MIQIKLISHSIGVNNELTDPELITATIKRVCTSTQDFESLIDSEKKDWRNKKTIIDGHLGILEHISFTFLIEGISRVCTHQIVRHRMASYLQMSLRYSSVENLDIVIPDTIRNSEFLDEYNEIFSKSKELYQRMINSEIPKEDARFIIPQGIETRIIVTMNARSLMHFFRIRLKNPHAQWEIRKVAELMCQEVKKVCPVLFSEEFSDYWE